MVKISIIVPVYNVEEYLGKCLDKLINQTLRDIEIICIDDGSTDNSPAILKEYASIDARIKIITQCNSGVSSARNNGLKLVRGEYIGFCDPDDWVDTDFYEKLYITATQYNADIVTANIIKVRKNKLQKFFTFKNTTVSEDYKEKLKICDVPDYSYIWNKIYKTKPLKESNLLFEEGKVYEDIRFSVQALALLKRLVTVPDTNYYYLSRPGSIIHNRQNDKDSVSAMEFVKEFFETHNVPFEEQVTTTRIYKISKFIHVKLKRRGKNFKIRIDKGW